MTFKLELEESETAFVMQVIGNLPTQSGAFPLFEKLQSQVKAQLPEPEKTGE